MNNPFANPFRTDAALRINARRLEHLAWMDLDVHGQRVLEVGAGEGMLTSFFLDRGCEVTVTDGRARNVRRLRSRFPGRPVLLLDLERPWPPEVTRHPIVFCYGTLYHLEQPLLALARLCAAASELLLLESMVGSGALAREPSWERNQSVTGAGCRPTWASLAKALSGAMPFAYEPVALPAHEDYPSERVVLVGSRRELANPRLRAIA